MNSVEIDGAGHLNHLALHPHGMFGEDASSCAYDREDGSNLDEVLSVAEPLQEAPRLLSSSTAFRSTARGSHVSVRNFLQTVPLLFTLTAEQITGLDVMVREYSAMDVIVEEGTLLQHMFVLASGTVEVVNTKIGLKRAFGHRRIGSITAPNVFGIDDVILESPTEFAYHASSPTTLLLVPKPQLLHLFAQSPLFASNVSCGILQTLPAFTIFQDFCRSIFGLSSHAPGASLEDGYCLSLAPIVDLFRMSGTTVHRLANGAALDTVALRYCVRRLPANMAQTYVFLLAECLPAYISSEFVADVTDSARSGLAPSIVPVDTGKRRRCAWEFDGGGQTIVIMRDGFTDTIDFMSNLCIFTIESSKVRHQLRKLSNPSAADLLREAITQQRAGEDYTATLRQLPFTDAEMEALEDIWGDRLLTQLYSIMVHREEYVVRIEAPGSRRFAEDAYSSWGLTIVRQLKRLLGTPDTADLPEDIVLDVLFSPNRTLKNLFCSMSEEIQALLTEDRAAPAEPVSATPPPWRTEEDRFYYILTGILEQDENIREAYRAQLEMSGFTLLEDAHSSALIVDIIDVSRLQVSGTDPALRAAAHQAKSRALAGRRHFLINVDKTFGAQIEATLRALLLVFGNRIRSVNVTGKAAGLCGNRGDVVLPSKLLFSKRSFGEGSNDETRRCNQNGLTRESVLRFLGTRGTGQVLSGTCITVPGFVLQSPPVIKFYKTVHNCTTMEMQSSYIARQLEECHRTGVLQRKITSRYLFYLDDMPLGNENGMGNRSIKRELISAIYATARALLCHILEA